MSCDESLVTLAILWEKFSKDLNKKTLFFRNDLVSRFKFNNLGLALETNLKFYTSVEKGFKNKTQKVLGDNSYVCRSYTQKNWQGGLLPTPPFLPPILNRVKRRYFFSPVVFFGYFSILIFFVNQSIFNLIVLVSSG